MRSRKKGVRWVKGERRIKMDKTQGREKERRYESRNEESLRSAPEEELSIQVGHINGVHIDDVDVPKARCSPQYIQNPRRHTPKPRYTNVQQINRLASTSTK